MAARSVGGSDTGWNPGTFVGVYAAGLAALVILLAILEQVGVPDRIIGYLFVISTLAVYAGIGLYARTVQVSQYFVAGRGVPAVCNGMATAADWTSSVSFLGLAGALYVFGYDGLAFVLGWAAGFVLIAVLIAPYLRKFGAYTVPDFLAARYGGHLARSVGVVVLVSCSLAFLAAQIYATGLIASRFLDIGFETAVVACFFAIVVCSMLGGMRAVTWTQVAQYLVLAVAYLAPVVILSVQRYGVPVPQLTYGQALQEISALEASFRSQGLAPAELSGYLTPFTSYDPLNFFGLIVCLMIGTASLPHILMRYFTTTGVRETRKSVAWSMVFIVIVFVTAPAYAAFAKLEIFQTVIGVSIDALPDWIYTYGNLGLVQVCSADATTVEAIRAACSAAGNTDGVLSLGELAIDRDAIVISMPEIAGLPYVIAGLVAAGGLAATLSTADGLLLAIANALSHDVYYKMADPHASTARRLFVARFLLLAVAAGAAWLAAARPADVLSIAAWAFSLAAAGNFPALVLGIWWKRCTTAGAVAGMAAGFGVTLYYLVMTQYGGMAEWFGVANISAALFGLPAGVIVMVAVSLVTPAPSRDVQDLVDELRRPRGRTVTEGGKMRPNAA